LSDGSIKLGKTRLKEEGFAFQQAHLQALIRSEDLVPLLVEREERLQVVPATDDWQPGDHIIYILHDPRPKLLKRLSGATQSSRLSLERLPEVEEVPLSAFDIPLEKIRAEQELEPEVVNPPSSS
jgi:hypothetical protein